MPLSASSGRSMKHCRICGMQSTATWPRISGCTGTSRQPRKRSPFFSVMTSNMRFAKVRFS